MRHVLDLTQPDVRTMHTGTAAIAYHPDGSLGAPGRRHRPPQGGPDSTFWDDIESTHRTWIQTGKPARRRYRLAITSQLQRILLDDSPDPVHELHPPHDE